jgi:hypothetical protein
LKQAHEKSLEKLQIVQQEKDDLREMFEEDREHIQREKYQLLVEQMGLREEFTRAVCSVSGLAQMEEETTESHVGKLAEAIYKLQSRVEES